MTAPRSEWLAILSSVLVLAACTDDPQLGPVSAPPLPQYSLSATAEVAGLDLGTLGGRASYAEAINIWGTVVGYSNTDDGSVHAFRWRRADGMKDMGTLPGDVESGAVSILATGEILGWSKSAAGTSTVVIWGPTGRIRRVDIPPPPDSKGAMAPTDFNLSGAIIGWTFTQSGSQRGWYWSSGSRTVDLRAEIPSCGENYPSAINGFGFVAGGYCEPNIGWLHAFLWHLGVTYTDLGIIGDEISRANVVALSLNDRNRVVGWILPGRLTSQSAYVWSKADGFALLPSPIGPAPYSYATGINDPGTIVGAATSSLNGDPIQAVAWPSADSFIRLTSAANKASVATAVSQRGQVAGWFSFDDAGTNHAMLWDLSTAMPATSVAASTPPVFDIEGLAAPRAGMATPESCLTDATAMASKGARMQCVLERM